MTLKLVAIGVTVMTLLISSVSNVLATGLRGDPGDDATSEEAECFVNGYDSGFAGKYDRERARDCVEHSDQYNEMWGVGCEDSLRTEEECSGLINNPVEIEDYEALYDQNVSDCNKAGSEDGKAGRPFNKEKEKGCYEFEDLTRGYEQGYQQGCETHTTEASCELKYEDMDNYCPNHPDIVGCVNFLHNATNKRTENPMSVCAGMGDPRPNIICPQESNPEKYCLQYDNPTFCKTIGDLCDSDGFVKPEYPYCTTNKNAVDFNHPE